MGPDQAQGRARTLASLVLRDPRLLADYISAWRAGRRAPGLEPPPPRLEGVLEPGEGIRAVAPGVVAGPALELVREQVAATAPVDGEAGRIASGLAGDPALGDLAYFLVRATQPEVVVETGVATGVTSAHVLAAFADNGSGRLESVDLPPLALRAAGLVGRSVPTALRDAWTYHWGSSRRCLPEVLDRCAGGLGVFIHDSDHSYEGMRWELERAWAALRPGGWLVADDAHLHSAFADVAAAAGADPVFVAQPSTAGCTGLARKS
jgi:Methyltransferase domain